MPAADVNGHLGRIRAGDQIRRAEQIEKLVVRKPAASPDDLILDHRDVRRRAAERDHAQLEEEERKVYERARRSTSLRRFPVGCFLLDQGPLGFRVQLHLARVVYSRLGATGASKQLAPQSLIHNNGEIALQLPGFEESAQWQEAFSLVRIINGHGVILDLKRDEGMRPLSSVDREQVDIDDRVASFVENSLQLIGREILYVGFVEAELARHINDEWGVRAEDRAITTRSQLGFGYREVEMGEDHSQASRRAGISGLLFVERRLRSLHNVGRKWRGRGLSSPRTACEI